MTQLVLVVDDEADVEVLLYASNFAAIFAPDGFVMDFAGLSSAGPDPHWRHW